MTDLEKAARLALEALESLRGFHICSGISCDGVITALRQALEQPADKPVAWTERELELIDEMIEVQLDHAKQCDSIANRVMAEKQKGWDMERVTLLQKIKHAVAQPADKPVAVKHMMQWVEFLKRLSDNGQHLRIPSELSAGTCFDLARELEQFIAICAHPPQENS